MLELTFVSLRHLRNTAEEVIPETFDGFNNVLKVTLSIHVRLALFEAYTHSSFVPRTFL